MKKIKSLRLASILLIGTLLTTCLLGGTFAKYTTEASGSSTATVAAWSIRANDKEIAVSPQTSYLFKLFDTIKDADGTSKESDVSSERIAPGTSGKFKMTIDNMSEVSAKYSIALEDTNTSGVPIQYSLNGTDWFDSVSEVAANNLTDLVLKSGDATAEHTLYWRWPFDNTVDGAQTSQSDASDSQLGHPVKNPIATVMVTATITASQID